MKWYWWILAGVLALNALVIVAVVLFMVYDWLRKRGMLSDERHRGGVNDEKH